MLAPVRRRDDFDALSRSRARGRSGPVWIVRASPSDGDDPAVRVAYAIPRTVGTAVVRNRLRRRLRAMIAELHREGRLTPGLHLVGARPGAVDLPAAELRRHLASAVADPAGRDR